MTQPYRAVVHAMAMAFSVELEGVEQGRAARAVADFQEDLAWADEVFSLWKSDSVLSQLSRGEVTLDDCPREVREVAEACAWYRDTTGGAFDARNADGVFDPTGIVKSWAVERAAQRTLKAAGATDWMVGAAGDVLLAPGGRVRRIGIADPRIVGDPAGSDVVDVIELGGEWTALATSGGAQDGDHIWDPATRAPARHVLQASVVGRDMVTCDAWATAIIAGGNPVLERAVKAGLQVLVITHVRPDDTLAANASFAWPSVL